MSHILAARAARPLSAGVAHRGCTLAVLAYIAAFLACTAITVSLHAEVHLGSPFTSHMVLQRDQPLPIWGDAEPDESVTVTFAGQTKTATADENGAWRVDLAPLPVSAEPRVMVVTGSLSDEPIELRDVVVGDIWLCAGEANVAVGPQPDADSDRNDPDAPNLDSSSDVRMFIAPWTRAYDPQTSVDGAWAHRPAKNVYGFGAVGRSFAHALQRALNVPVGIVVLTCRASTPQAWIRRETIAADARGRAVLDAFDTKVKAYTPPTEADFRHWQEAATRQQSTDAIKSEKKQRLLHVHPNPAQDPRNPTVLFNGMVAPFVPMPIRGVLWYQADAPTLARDELAQWNAMLVADWRAVWRRELPFELCQLGSSKDDEPATEFRAAENRILTLPSTGLAVTYDTTDIDVIGARLCRLALAHAYGQKLEASGPTLETLTSVGGALRLRFAHTAGGLSDHGSDLKTFEVAGRDGVFRPATANIDGASVFVSSPDVAVPVAVRYAWSEAPTDANLYNGAGLPAAPFSAALPSRPPTR